MNKFAKGSLAAGAGLVLLLGGAGTLAYWNDSAELAGGTINAGTLTLEADNDALQASIDQQPQVWVPGDQHTFSTALTLVTEGDNIQGEIVLDAAKLGINGTGADQFTVDMALGDGTEIPAASELSFDADTDVITFNGPGTYTIPVDVTVALPFQEDEQNASKNLTIDLEDLTFTATQTAAPDAVR